jgi:hypothetical protein
VRTAAGAPAIAARDEPASQASLREQFGAR